MSNDDELAAVMAEVDKRIAAAGREMQAAMELHRAYKQRQEAKRAQEEPRE
jgi:hypothetical protein